ncbi:MAG TPA: hypothetical protein QGF66_01245 [SAR86 cluster bacterium]|jgi:AcrR family transcriptional regulator|nr:hypothetical protein [SAR86 cluster bacterium]
MVNSPAKLKDRAVKGAVNNLRKDKRVEAINLALIANELDVTLEVLKNYYSSTEDIFLKAQKKDWDSLHRYWDKRIEKAKTPGDYKEAFEFFFERFVETLSDDADLMLEMSCYLPACIKYRERNKKKVKKKFFSLIKKGWPGKEDKVLKRQTELITIVFYGFIDHVVHIKKAERIKLLSDFRNMVNLQLQDRKFF